jgi:hypothetical protein
MALLLLRLLVVVQGLDAAGVLRAVRCREP